MSALSVDGRTHRATTENQSTPAREKPWVKCEPGLTGSFFHWPADQQRQRIRELHRSGFSVDAIALITHRGLHAVRAALEEAL